MSNWENDPATSAQLQTIRNFYAKEIGWNAASGAVQSLKDARISKKDASVEIKRLYECKSHGWPTGPEN